jgi:thiol-disulfide isomerase/thioredoxin
MQERLLIVLVLAAAVMSLALACRWYVRRRAATALASRVPAPVDRLLPAEGAAILYFHGPHCGACTQQARVLEALAKEQAVTVIPVEAAHLPEATRHFGILTIPATVVVDQARHVTAINLGFRSRVDLAGQVARATTD